MRAFEYASPETKEQAVGLLAASWGQSEVLAGGTDLLALMKDDILQPRRVVNLKEIPELRGVSASADGLRIGALTTLGDLADNANVIENYPTLAEALNEAASPQIRNVATLGGNLCQRPRCWYFRNGFGLLPRDSNGRDLVAEGENRYHAILGNDGPAKFVSPSSIAPVLIAYGAKIRLQSPKGRRDLELDKFYVIPKSAEQREHDLAPNEIITEIILPPAAQARVAHYEVRQKQAFDWPLAVSAVALRMDGSTVRSARVVLGYVAPTPWLSREAEQALARKTISRDVATAAAEAALQNARPLSHNTYKIQLARISLKRAILRAGGVA